ncbi:uncharacterized protein ACN427_004511 isoform 2-T2 [Glossina fuscipes fuscipes]
MTIINLILLTVILQIGSRLTDTVKAEDPNFKIICENEPSGTFLPHKDDCTRFMRCFMGKPFEFRCFHTYRWNPTTQSCVPANTTECMLYSEYETAKLEKQQLEETATEETTAILSAIMTTEDYNDLSDQSSTELDKPEDEKVTETQRENEANIITKETSTETAQTDNKTQEPLSLDTRKRENPCVNMSDGTFLPHETDCKHFIKCSRGEPHEFYCPKTFMWDQSRLSCIFEDLVPCLVYADYDVQLLKYDKPLLPGPMSETDASMPITVENLTIPETTAVDLALETTVPTPVGPTTTTLEPTTSTTTSTTPEPITSTQTSTTSEPTTLTTPEPTTSTIVEPTTSTTPESSTSSIPEQRSTTSTIMSNIQKRTISRETSIAPQTTTSTATSETPERTTSTTTSTISEPTTTTMPEATTLTTSTILDTITSESTTSTTPETTTSTSTSTTPEPIISTTTSTTLEPTTSTTPESTTSTAISTTSTITSNIPKQTISRETSIIPETITSTTTSKTLERTTSTTPETTISTLPEATTSTTSTTPEPTTSTTPEPTTSTTPEPTTLSIPERATSTTPLTTTSTTSEATRMAETTTTTTETTAPQTRETAISTTLSTSSVMIPTTESTTDIDTVSANVNEANVKEESDETEKKNSTPDTFALTISTKDNELIAMQRLIENSSQNVMTTQIVDADVVKSIIGTLLYLARQPRGTDDPKELYIMYKPEIYNIYADRAFEPIGSSDKTVAIRTEALIEAKINQMPKEKVFSNFVTTTPRYVMSANAEDTDSNRSVNDVDLPQEDSRCNIDPLARFPASRCSQFYQCSDGYAFLLDCQHHYKFDSIYGKCIPDSARQCW